MRTGVIAFCGSKGSGKSTSASIFKTIFNGPTEELAFAGHLKNVCSKVFNVDMKYFLDPKLKEVELDSYINLTGTNIQSVLKEFYITEYDFDTHVRPHMGRVFYTGRSLLQYVGTEVLHPLDPLIHVKVTMKNKDPNKLSIITDLRFTQEFEYLEKRDDFVPVYVHNVQAEEAAKSDTHPSERQLELFKDRCLKLDNNLTLHSLQSFLTHLVETRYRSACGSK